MATKDSLLLPQHSAYPLVLTAERDEALKTLADSMLEAEPALSIFSPYAPGMHGEMLDAPSLVIEDHGSIRLFEHSGDEAYSYRALLLAGNGDLVAIGVERSSGFENYCRDWLGLGSPQLLIPELAGPDDSLATRCLKDREFVATVARHAETHNGLNILPYMGNWRLWELAGAIADQSRAPVRVIAPPPQLTRRVNDKIWFTQLVQSVCGQAAIPPAHDADSFAGLCRLAMEFAATHRSIAVKLPNSASSAGNLVLDAREISGLSWHTLHDQLEQRLGRLGWNHSFPLQVVAWKQAVTSSPSAQLWIPAPAEGVPLVEALFEQHTTGTSREFDGARPCRLKHELQLHIAEQAFEIGRVLQHLGYIGRCSLDAIIVDAGDENEQLHWVECNGRWGGVSIPMTLNRRLDHGRATDGCFAIFEAAHQHLTGREMEGVLRSLEPWLYGVGKRKTGAVLLSPGRLLDGSGFEFMVRDGDINAVLRTGTEVTRLLGNAGNQGH